MTENIINHLQKFDFDVRKSKDARFMDQKVTPDVLSIIADCVLNYDADRNIEFTKDDIWNDNYFNTNVKFTSQPLRTLAYSGVLEMQKLGNRNVYKIANKSILEFIGMKERNAYIFLYHYLEKVLSDSNMLRFFEVFKQKCLDGTIDNAAFQDLKTRFQRFIIGNTPINGTTEVNRIFPKILNVYSCENNIEGTIKVQIGEI